MKDTNNLVDYNIWSGTEYTKTATIVQKTVTTISSNQFSAMGEDSYKITNNNDGYNYVDFMKYYAEVNETLTYKATVFTDTPVILSIVEVKDAVTYAHNVEVPVCKTFKEISLTAEINNIVDFVYIRVAFFNNQGTCYVDNISLVSG